MTLTKNSTKTFDDTQKIVKIGNSYYMNVPKTLVNFHGWKASKFILEKDENGFKYTKVEES